MIIRVLLAVLLAFALACGQAPTKKAPQRTTNEVIPKVIRSVSIIFWLGLTEAERKLYQRCLACNYADSMGVGSKVVLITVPEPEEGRVSFYALVLELRT